MWFDREDLSKEIGYTIESFFLLIDFLFVNQI